MTVKVDDYAMTSYHIPVHYLAYRMFRLSFIREASYYLTMFGYLEAPYNVLFQIKSRKGY